MKTLFGLMINFYDGLEGLLMRLLDWECDRRKKARERWIKCGGLDSIKEG